MCDVIFAILQYFYDDGESQPYNDITGVAVDEKCNAGK